MIVERAAGTSFEPLIQLENLELAFSHKRGALAHRTMRALDGVSLTIGRGEVVGVVGESGSGKTTLGKATLRLYQPKGRILYRGADLAALSERALLPLRRDLQMVFQDPLSSFNPRFRMGNSLVLPLLLHDIAQTKSEALRLAVELVQSVGLQADCCERFPHQLSGGQLQRVAIARAIGIRPKLIVADEAVSKLDVSVRAQVLNLIRRLNRENGVSFMFITHDLAVARFLSNRVAVMYRGRIVELGDTDRIFSNPQHPYTRSLLNARKQAIATEGQGAPDDRVDAGNGCNFACACPRRQSRCLEHPPVLAPLTTDHSVACFYSGHVP
jgi:oligopeptide transport system ATP-binding protein